MSGTATHNKKFSDVRIPAACRNAYVYVPGSYSSRREKVSTAGPTPMLRCCSDVVLLFRSVSIGYHPWYVPYLGPIYASIASGSLGATEMPV